MVPDRRADIAALVNGLLVVLVPIVLTVTLPLVLTDPNTTTVRPENASRISGFLELGAAMIPVLAPLALIAGWRTRVHALRWCDRDGTGWRGVLEAAASGFLVAILVLSPGILTRPVEAPPYVIAYGGGALMLGLLVGLFLRTTALVTLRLSTRAAQSSAP